MSRSGRRYRCRDPLRAVALAPTPGAPRRPLRARRSGVPRTRSAVRLPAADPALPRALADAAARRSTASRARRRPCSPRPCARSARWSCSSIDQAAYAEYVDSLQAPTYLTIFSAEPMPGHGVLEIPLPATMTCVDHMLGGPGAADQPERPLTEIEGGVVARLRRAAARRDALLASSTSSRSSPTVTGVEYSPQFAQVAGASDVMVVAHLRAADQRALLPDDHLPAVLRPAAAPGQAPPRPPRSPTASAPSAARAADLLQQQFAAGPGRGRGPLPADPRRPERPRRPQPSATSSGSTHPAAAPLDVTVDDIRLRPRHRRCAGPPPRRPDRGHPEGELMTTVQITPRQSELAVAAATRRGAVLPAVEPLTAADAQPGTEHVTGTFAGAAIADLEPAGLGRIAVLVAADLVEALASSPLGGLDLAAATQPALDAVAARARHARPAPARAVELALVVADLGTVHRRPARRLRHRRRSPGHRRRAGGGRGSDQAAAASIGDAPEARPFSTTTPITPAAAPVAAVAHEPARHRDAARRRHGGHRRARPHPDDRPRPARAVPRRRARARPRRRQPGRPAGQRPADRPRRGRRRRRGLRPARHRDRRRQRRPS